MFHYPCIIINAYDPDINCILLFYIILKGEIDYDNFLIKCPAHEFDCMMRNKIEKKENNLLQCY